MRGEKRCCRAPRPSVSPPLPPKISSATKSQISTSGDRSCGPVGTHNLRTKMGAHERPSSSWLTRLILCASLAVCSTRLPRGRSAPRWEWSACGVPQKGGASAVETIPGGGVRGWGETSVFAVEGRCGRAGILGGGGSGGLLGGVLRGGGKSKKKIELAKEQEPLPWPRPLLKHHRLLSFLSRTACVMASVKKSASCHEFTRTSAWRSRGQVSERALTTSLQPSRNRKEC